MSHNHDQDDVLDLGNDHFFDGALSRRFQTATERDNPVASAARASRFVQGALTRLLEPFTRSSSTIRQLPMSLLWLGDAPLKAAVLHLAESLISDSGVFIGLDVARAFETSGTFVIAHWAVVVAALDVAVDRSVPFLNSFGGLRCAAAIVRANDTLEFLTTLQIRRARAKLKLASNANLKSESDDSVVDDLVKCLLRRPKTFTPTNASLVLLQTHVLDLDPMSLPSVVSKAALEDFDLESAVATLVRRISSDSLHTVCDEAVRSRLNFASHCGVGLVTLAALVAVIELRYSTAISRATRRVVFRDLVAAICATFDFSKTVFIKVASIARAVFTANGDVKSVSLKDMARREPGLKRRSQSPVAAPSSSESSESESEIMRRAEHYCDVIADVRFAVRCHRDSETTVVVLPDAHRVVPANCTDCCMPRVPDGCKSFVASTSAPLLHLAAQSRILDLLLAVEGPSARSRMPTLVALQSRARGHAGAPNAALLQIETPTSLGLHRGRCASTSLALNAGITIGVIAGWTDEALLARAGRLTDSTRSKSFKALLDPPTLAFMGAGVDAAGGEMTVLRAAFGKRPKGRPRHRTETQGLHRTDSDAETMEAPRDWGDEVLDVIAAEGDEDVQQFIRTDVEREHIRRFQRSEL